MAKKVKIPKRIAGIKVPKNLRRSARPLAAMFDSPTGRAILADALMHVARSLSGTKVVRDAAGDAGRTARDMREGAAGLLSDAAGKLASTAEDARHR